MAKHKKPMKKKSRKPAAAPGTRAPVQITLPITEPVEHSFIAELRKRLGHRAFVSISLVASACDVSAMTVQSWREAGLIESVNVSATQKPYYRIHAPSILRFFERRIQS